MQRRKVWKKKKSDTGIKVGKKRQKNGATPFEPCFTAATCQRGCFLIPLDFSDRCPWCSAHWQTLTKRWLWLAGASADLLPRGHTHTSDLVNPLQAVMSCISHTSLACGYHTAPCGTALFTAASWEWSVVHWEKPWVVFIGLLEYENAARFRKLINNKMTANLPELTPVLTLLFPRGFAWLGVDHPTSCVFQLLWPPAVEEAAA